MRAFDGKRFPGGALEQKRHTPAVVGPKSVAADAAPFLAVALRMDQRGTEHHYEEPTNRHWQHQPQSAVVVWEDVLMVAQEEEEDTSSSRRLTDDNNRCDQSSDRWQATIPVVALPGDSP